MPRHYCVDHTVNKKDLGQTDYINVFYSLEKCYYVKMHNTTYKASDNEHNFNIPIKKSRDDLELSMHLINTVF